METHWQEINNYVINRAKTLLSTTNSTFVLGAGVSKDANIPDWETLLAKLIPTKDTVFRPTDYKAINKHLNHSDIRAARYIKSAFYQKDLNDKDSNDNIFVDKVRKILYSSIDRKAPLIKTICDIICDDSKRVQSVITYNYDDVIEEELKKRGFEHYSVFRKNRSNDYYKFPIYHVHGFVPQIGNASKIVLCEEDYHEIYSYAFHWSNIEQLHAFERNTCFFIGLSMNDPNLRRLLEVAFKDSEQEQSHFIFLPRTPLFTSDEETPNREQKIDEDFSIREEVLHKLGLQIIWYEDGKFEQINSILKQIGNIDEPML